MQVRGNRFKQEKWTIENFIEKISNSSEAVVTFALMIHCSGNIRKFPEKCLRPETCSVTKYRSHHAVSFLQFSENCAKATRQSPKKTFMVMVSLKEKISCDL